MATTSPPLGRRRRLAPEARRAELLVALEQVVAEHGHAKATVPLVVARAGVSQGSFYRYFRHLNDAFSALAAEVIAPIASAGLALDLRAARSPSEVEAELLRYYSVLAAQLGERAALVREVLLAGMAAREPLREQLGAFLRAMRDHVRELAQAQMGRPPFDVADPDIAAGALVGMILGATHEAVSMGERFDPEAWARELARFETKLLCRTAVDQPGHSLEEGPHEQR